jgi:hypothetical protein
MRLAVTQRTEDSRLLGRDVLNRTYRPFGIAVVQMNNWMSLLQLICCSTQFPQGFRRRGMFQERR